MASRASAIFVGIRGAVVAIDRDSGETIWQSELKGTDFVSVTLQEADLFAASRGRVYRLDPSSGAILWSNACRTSQAAAPGIRTSHTCW